MFAINNRIMLKSRYRYDQHASRDNKM